jgi:hypothetical protein
LKVKNGEKERNCPVPNVCDAQVACAEESNNMKDNGVAERRVRISQL